jgi:hypothetical protein
MVLAAGVGMNSAHAMPNTGDGICVWTQLSTNSTHDVGDAWELQVTVQEMHSTVDGYCGQLRTILTITATGVGGAYSSDQYLTINSSTHVNDKTSSGTVNAASNVQITSAAYNSGGGCGVVGHGSFNSGYLTIQTASACTF